MSEWWLQMCADELGFYLPVNDLQPDRFGFRVPDGYPPVPLLGGDNALDIYLSYNINEVKHGRVLD